ncbi:MAG: hypothetical protein IMZ66_01615, partial [Planctomycetes bacterium]|nr:hypothetical protein [Planctomycetota bacterium]
LDHAIRANRRPDGLYHAYNLLGVSADRRRASVDHLYEMLEGQVAALSSGAVDPEEAVRLLQALRASRLYRPDQDSYLLYPDRDLPGFLAKNVAPAGDVKSNPLLAALLRAGNTAILLRDAAGNHRFNADFMNAKDLQAALQTLARDERWQEAVRTHGPAVIETFERVFNHRAFTGRSGTMYGYEGLGCIYWHMVAKLLLAVQECFRRALREGRPAPVVRSLAQAYYAVRAGLGFNKTAAAFGAFPTDPYSHTPGHAGAQQPGMTGQVKEEILTRMGELGVGVEDGALILDPVLLRRREFLREPEKWRYADVAGRPCTMPLRPGTLAFTFCQTPVIYEQAPGPARLRVVAADGAETILAGNRLDPRRSQAVFGRTGEVRALYADIPAGTILLD